MKKIFFYVLLLVAAGLMSCSEEEPTSMLGRVYGIVSDLETGEPIKGVSVTLSPSNLTTVTGSDGHYEFIDVEPGQYKIHCQASGYLSNSKSVVVTAGASSTADVMLASEQAIPGIQLSTNTLNFGKQYSELTLTISNIGTAGSFDWSITGITKAWLNVTPASGRIDMGGSAVVKVMIDRDAITQDETTFITFVAGGNSQTIMVSVETTLDDSGNTGGNDGGSTGNEDSGNTSGDDGGNTGGDDSGNTGGDDGGDVVIEDYSSASVESGDYRIVANIVSCRRSGSTVTFTYTLRNEGLGSLNDFRIYTTNSNSLIIGAYRTVITDDNYNNYIESSYTFNGQSTSQSYVLVAGFPEMVNCKGTVVVKNFDRSAQKLSVILGVWAYDIYPDALADPRIYFENVPIY